MTNTIEFFLETKHSLRYETNPGHYLHLADHYVVDSVDTAALCAARFVGFWSLESCSPVIGTEAIPSGALPARAHGRFQALDS